MDTPIQEDVRAHYERDQKKLSDYDEQEGNKGSPGVGTFDKHTTPDDKSSDDKGLIRWIGPALPAAVSPTMTSPRKDTGAAPYAITGGAI